VNIVKLLTEGLNDAVAATFAVEPDPEKAAVLIHSHIEGKRKKIELPHAQV
jgi:anaerobic carbon-monoxide dehydrogenase catalytic subunit